MELTSFSTTHDLCTSAIGKWLQHDPTGAWNQADGAAPECPMVEKCYQSFRFPSRVAGFDLNPKVPLLPSLRRKTLGGGRVSTWTAACASSWTDLDKSVSTSTAHICANAGACGCARLAGLCADTWTRARACARSHTHPKLPPG